jgi:hypothetical protein
MSGTRKTGQGERHYGRRRRKRRGQRMKETVAKTKIDVEGCGITIVDDHGHNIDVP